MTTNVAIKNLNNPKGGHAVVVHIVNSHPVSTPPKPVVINPGEEHEFTLTAAQGLKVDEANGLNS